MEDLLTLLTGLLGLSIFINIGLFWTSRFNNKPFDIYSLMDHVSKRKDLYINIYFGSDGYNITIYPTSILEETNER